MERTCIDGWLIVFCGWVFSEKQETGRNKKLKKAKKDEKIGKFVKKKPSPPCGNLEIVYTSLCKN